MVVGQGKLAGILLYSLFLGFFLGVFFDLFKIRRTHLKIFGSCGNDKKIKQRLEQFLIFFEDVVFALVASVCVCIFLYYVNSGRFRILVLIGCGTGFLIYCNTLSKVILYCSGIIIRFVYLITGKLFNVLVKPLGAFVFYIYDVTVGRIISYAITSITVHMSLRLADIGFGITRIKGRIRNEKTFKYIRKSCDTGVHSVLHGDNNKDAV